MAAKRGVEGVAAEIGVEDLYEFLNISAEASEKEVRRGRGGAI